MNDMKQAGYNTCIQAILLYGCWVLDWTVTKRWTQDWCSLS